MLTRGDSGDYAEAVAADNELVTVFFNGKLVKEQSLSMIRDRLHQGQF